MKTTMDITIVKERAKNFLSCEMCTKYTLSADMNGIVYTQAYYGYPKRLAISKFKQYVKLAFRQLELMSENQ